MLLALAVAAVSYVAAERMGAPTWAAFGLFVLVYYLALIEQLLRVPTKVLVVEAKPTAPARSSIRIGHGVPCHHCGAQAHENCTPGCDG